MDDSARTINHSFSKENVFVNANENVNSISNAHNTVRIRRKTGRRITKRKIRKATYAFFL
jgi:hypothetical protein